MMGSHGTADSTLNADGQRNVQLAAGHVMQLRGMIDELIHRKRDEIDEHDLDHGLESGKSRPDRKPRHRTFAYRRIHHATAEGLCQSGRYAEGSPKRHILAEKINRGIATHLLFQ